MINQDLAKLQEQINAKQAQNVNAEISPEDKQLLAETTANANANAIIDLAKKPAEFIAVKLSNEVSKQMEHNDSVKQRVASSADKIINTGLKVQENQIDQTEHATDLALKKDVYTHFGINTTVNKAWKRRMYELFDDFWDIVIGVSTGFTIVPISKVVDRFTNITSKWLRGVAVLAGLISLGAFIFLLMYGIKLLYAQVF